MRYCFIFSLLQFCKPVKPIIFKVLMQGFRSTSNMKKSIFYLLLFITIKAMPQLKMRGEYIFSRQEMVAGFNFLPDGKFQFFYSYGAVDRSATGTFSIKGDTLKLKSDKEAGKDFTIADQSKQQNGYTLIFDNSNKYLYSDIK